MDVHFLLLFRFTLYIIMLIYWKLWKDAVPLYALKREKQVTTKFLEGTLSNKYLAHLKQDFK